MDSVGTRRLGVAERRPKGERMVASTHQEQGCWEKVRGCSNTRRL